LYQELEIKPADNESIFENGHLYIYATQWLSANKAKLQITGHGEVDPGGFALIFEYT